MVNQIKISFKILVIVLILTLFGNTNVQAAMVTFSDTIQGEWSTGIYDVGLTQFNIEGFDSSMGTLTEIQFLLTVEVYGDVTFTNTTSNTGTLERSVWGQVTMLGLGFSLYAPGTAGPIVLPVGARETVYGEFGPVVSTATASSDDATFFSSFIDPAGGTVILNASTAIDPGGTIYGDNGANFTGNITDYHNIVTGVLDVSYVYASSSVPLPSTVLLLGAGLVGLAGFKKKFRRA